MDSIWCTRSRLTCKGCLPTRQTLSQHEAASSWLLVTVHRRHRAWPIIRSLSATDCGQNAEIANLSSGEVVASRERGRVLVQCGLAILMFRVIWEMRKTKKSRFLWLSLLLQVIRVHYRVAKGQLYCGHSDEVGRRKSSGVSSRHGKNGERKKVVLRGRDSNDSGLLPRVPRYSRSRGACRSSPV